MSKPYIFCSYKCVCWVCDTPNPQVVKLANITEPLTSESFAITDSHYGQTEEIQRCQNCGFLQCSDFENVLSFYEQLEDVAYEETRAERMLQAQKLLEILQKYRSKGTFFDIGAGSGILVEAALKMGYDAEGIEPSLWLQQQAQKHQLPVYAGSFPDDCFPDTKPRHRYDIVTLIDVIEHVPNPGEVVAEVAKILSEDGIVAVVTPDVGSLAAKILGWKWWHFRVAHIGYFNRKTLNLMMKRAGFECVKMTRPTWYFPAEYLLERLAKYLPFRLPISSPAWMKKIVIPLNLGDSLLGIYQRKRKAE
ncbi:class I SAM-dependent methyltransferase [Oscillatoriales cyanobacterium LEGE 11467]|uniref:Class I SAM-dependent methyltransferase n=1 Tax=Zarconia navalis LEGE 11467 TaxID=1828826 RepID=A0A928W258_9CYAN|nr:class I SAM-dependent methyltransferase [Zarconia navalis]MBE9041885.1 class I SAM-dependent methyltransferase [Zarconia navalis LEGE 11467]